MSTRVVERFLAGSESGHDVSGFHDPIICPLYDDPACNCPREFPCADVLITDNAMPRMTGLEFIKRQALRGCKGVMKHKAVMSGSWTNEELRESEKLGCKVFWKPVNLPEFLHWLGECQDELDQSRQTQT